MMCFKSEAQKHARVAQLVEHDLAKVGAAGSSPSRALINKKYSNEYFLFFVHNTLSCTIYAPALSFIISFFITSSPTT